MDGILTTFHLDPASFPDRYLAILVPFHAAAALLAAVVFCPLALFARKGTGLHRLGGLGVVTLGAIVVVSSFFLVVDSGINQIVVNATVFPAGEYNQFYLVLLSFVFGYYVFSAARIWPRLAASKQGQITATWFDWMLAGLALFAAAIYVVTSIATMGSNNALAGVYLLAALLITPFACFDIFSFLAPERLRKFPWWLLHMAKMVVVWVTLIRFIFLRIADVPASEFVIHQIVALWVILALWAIVAALHWPSMQPQSARPT